MAEDSTAVEETKVKPKMHIPLTNEQQILAAVVRIEKLLERRFDGDADRPQPLSKKGRK